METELLQLPAWFWNLIDESKPNLSLLEKKLETIDNESLENYYGLFITAACSLCDYEPWNGMRFNDEIGRVNQSKTEYFTQWIVGQGYDYWSSIARLNNDQEAKSKALTEAYREYSKNVGEELHPSLVEWRFDPPNPNYKPGFQSPFYLAVRIFERIHGFEIYEIEDAISDRVHELLK